MFAEIHHVFRNPQVVECSQVVIRDHFNQPIAVILEPSPGTYVVKRWDDHDWHKTLAAVGLPDNLVVDTIAGPKPTSIVLSG